MTRRAAVMGAGSWGTALANLLAAKGIETIVWSFEADVADEINHAHANSRYLDGIPLDARLRATRDMAEALRGADLVLSVSPSHVVRQVMGEAAASIEPGALIVSASKGIENESLKMMDAVLADVLPPELARTACFLSGPSFAREVGLRYPTAVTMASDDAAAAVRAQQAFQTPYFRVYTTHDVRGV